MARIGFIGQLADEILATMKALGHIVLVLNTAISLKQGKVDVLCVDTEDHAVGTLPRAILQPTCAIPIIAIVPARGPNRLTALRSGADCCLARPFTSDELEAQIQAVLRRFNGKLLGILRVADLELNQVERTVRRDRKLIHLSSKEFLLLELLMRHSCKIVNRHEIAKVVWKMPLSTTSNIIEVYVNYLRKKIDSTSQIPLLHTIRGQGYCVCSEPRTVMLENASDTGVPSHR